MSRHSRVRALGFMPSHHCQMLQDAGRRQHLDTLCMHVAVPGRTGQDSTGRERARTHDQPTHALMLPTSRPRWPSHFKPDSPYCHTRLWPRVASLPGCRGRRAASLRFALACSRATQDASCQAPGPISRFVIVRGAKSPSSVAPMIAHSKRLRRPRAVTRLPPVHHKHCGRKKQASSELQILLSLFRAGRA